MCDGRVDSLSREEKETQFYLIRFAITVCGGLYLSCISFYFLAFNLSVFFFSVKRNRGRLLAKVRKVTRTQRERRGSTYERAEKGNTVK